LIAFTLPSAVFTRTFSPSVSTQVGVSWVLPSLFRVATKAKFFPFRSLSAFSESRAKSRCRAGWGEITVSTPWVWAAAARDDANPYQGGGKVSLLLPVPRKVSLGVSVVSIEWSDGHRSVCSNRRLRESCPCAMCAGEPPAIGVSRVIPLVPAAPEDVAAKGYSMVGRYAIAFAWSDGHTTGIYPYGYLLEMCECDSCSDGRGGPAGKGALIPER
jgi:DUF971 family protein